LENFLLRKGFTKDDILKVGLTKKSEKGKIYDRFRNRIIFPIFDEKNNSIAFSGRDFSGKDNTAKYLNSPETIFFDKSSVLYGFNFAKVEARKRKYFVLVEGQMDLVMNHKVGFENTVASSGTALTEKHLKKMSHFSKNLIFAFDSDKAGIEAAFRGIKKAIALDFDVKIVDIDSNSDPADMILNNETK
jgi:DNA primase